VGEPERQEAPEYRFEEVLVDTRARRVFRAGLEVPLEPKAYGVLLVLLREPQVAIHRDRLLDEVWGHRHVTPAVLNRIIAILRRALGDDADHPRLIRTVHGIGYSFIGALDETRVPAAPLQPSRDYFRTRVGWLVAAATALVAIAWWALAVRQPDAPESMQMTPAGRAEVRLALLPIEATSPGDAVIARGLTDLLDEALARSTGLILTALESTRLAAARERDPMRLGILLGTDYLLQGRLVPVGNEVEFTIELLRASDGASLWRDTHHQPRDELILVLGPTVSAVRRELRLGTDNAPMDPVLRASAVVQALYFRSRVTWQATPGALAEHLALLERAVAEDPGFAIGWVAIAEAHRQRYQQGEANIDEAMRSAREALDRALAIDPNLVEALLVASMIATNQWRSPEALGVSRRAIELAPNDARVLAIRGNVLSYLGRPRESLALRQRSAALNPLSWFTHYTMANDHALLGQHQAALEALQRGLEMSGDQNDPSAIDVRIELAFGNPAAALRRPRATGEPGGTQAASRLYQPMARAQAYAVIGDIAAAETELAALKPLLPEAPIFVDGHLSVYWAGGRYAESLRWLLNEGRGAAQHPWQTAATAHARALTEDTSGALADYASALEGPADRELLFNNWYPTRFGPAQLANWIALRKAAGLDHAAELADYAARLDRAHEGGTAIPVMDYHRAALAALRDDPGGADAALLRAFARGWFDPIALEVDLAWRPYRGSAWLERHRAALAAKAAAERARLRDTGSE